MCPWVGSHAPSCGRQLQGLPSCVEYLSPPGVLLRPVYGTIASPLWLELRRPAAWQATPSWAVCRHAWYRLLPWFQGHLPWSPMQPGWARTSGLAVPLLPLARQVGWVAPVRLTLRVWFVAPCPSAALGACPSVVSRATWRLFAGMRALLCSVRGGSGHLALVHQCARCVRYVSVVGGFVGDPPLLLFFCVCLFFFLVPSSLCVCSIFFNAFSRLPIPL